jgi:secreted trypsin-like serine protease
MNGKPGTYGVVDVYTRISSYVDWIDMTIAG